MDPYYINDDIFNNADEEEWLKEYLSVEDLKRMTGHDDLRRVKRLEAQIDAVSQSVGPLGERLPNLIELRLNGGLVHSLRDLGTSLSNIRVLHLGRCGVEDLSGAFSFSKIEELYLPFNNIKDLSPLASMTKLRVLDVESNDIADMSNLQFVSRCPLEMITVTGNPLQVPGYQELIKEMFPTVDIIDDDVDATDFNQRVDITAILEELDSQLPSQQQTEPRSDYIKKLFDEELSAAPPVAEICNAEKLAIEKKSVFKAVKELRFCDPYASLDLKNDFSPSAAPAVDATPTEEMWDVVNQINNTRKAIANGCQNSPTGASELTHHTSTIFCGNATRSLRNRKHESLPSSP